MWAGLLAVILFTWVAYKIWIFPGETLVPQKLQYGIVLGATANGSVPTPVFQKRIDQAIALYHSDRVETLIFTGGPGDPPQAEVGKLVAQAAGVPPDRILTETWSTNTLENLFFAQQLIPEERGIHIAIISDGFHLKRSFLLAKGLGLEAFPIATNHSAYRSWTSRSQFVARETLAYLYYRFLDFTGILDRKISSLRKTQGKK